MKMSISSTLVVTGDGFVILIEEVFIKAKVL